MKILAMDTSANVATVAVTEDRKLIAECVLNHKKTHSEKIMPMVDMLLTDSEIDIAEIDLFAVANGPGSFTGLRIGVSTAKALSQAQNKQIVGISTLEGMAYNLFDVDGLISPIMDARRGQVYNGVYKWQNGKLKEITPPRALSIEECLLDFQDEEKVYFVGDGVPVHKETIIKTMGERAVFVPDGQSLPRASSLAFLAYDKFLEGKAQNYIELMPIYLRKPQAEREYEEKQIER